MFNINKVDKIVSIPTIILIKYVLLNFPCLLSFNFTCNFTVSITGYNNLTSLLYIIK